MSLPDGRHVGHSAHRIQTNSPLASAGIAIIFTQSPSCTPFRLECFTNNLYSIFGVLLLLSHSDRHLGYKGTRGQDYLISCSYLSLLCSSSSVYPSLFSRVLTSFEQQLLVLSLQTSLRFTLLLTCSYCSYSSSIPYVIKPTFSVIELIDAFF